MKFSIICPETGLINKDDKKYPVVYFIGRNENLERKILRVQYFPYLYLIEKDYLFLKKSNYFKGLHIHKVEGVAERNLAKQAMIKIYVYDCGRIKDNIKAVAKLNKQGVSPNSKYIVNRTVYTYEADLSSSENLALRYMIDKGIKSGVEVDDKTGEILGPIDFIVPKRKWLIDFEAYTFKEYSSGINPKDPLNMVTFFDSYESKLYTFYTKNCKWELKRQKNQMFKPFTSFPHEIKMFDTEAQFLDALMEKVKEKQPDKFLAWNGNRYDFPKWKQRVDLNRDCLYRFSSISPLKSVFAYGSKMHIKGRILFDLMVAFKLFTDAELSSYALAYITKEEELDIGGTAIEKVPFKGTAGQCWDNYPDIVFQRNVMDVLILLALDKKYGINDTFEDKQTEFGTLPHEVFTTNRIIDTELMRMCKNEVILKTTQYEKTDKTEAKLLGARVVEPILGEFQYAFQFDFSGEYPNLIQGFNISPETYVEHSKVKDFSTVHNVKYHDELRGDMQFCFLKQPMGLLPRLIKRFKDKRKEYRTAQEKAILNNELENIIKMWERRQYNVKKNTNAIYGVMDYSKFRLHRPECTQATAVLGRISAEVEYSFLPSIGYKLLYGDTDSFFVLAHSRSNEELLEEGKKLCEILNIHLSEYFSTKYGIQKAPAELGFKAIYSWIMFVGKKNYCAEYIWDEKRGWKTGLDIKGIASVRSDASTLEKVAMKTLISMMPPSKNNSNEVLEAFIANILKDFDEHKFGPMEISYPAQIKKPLKRNNNGDWVINKIVKVLPSHYKSALYSNSFLNTEYLQGDKPRRLPIKFPKLKTVEGQQTLDNSSKYPTRFIYHGKLRDKYGKVFTDKEFKVTDISITEDMTIPDYFLNHVDYVRIRERLENKLRTLMDIHKGEINNNETS